MKLIDADAIEYHVVWKEPWLPNGSRYAKAVFKDEIDEAQTVDAVQVIRCRDCKHAIVSAQMEHNDGSTTDYYLCSLWHRPTEADGFCHRAEGRMDDD